MTLNLLPAETSTRTTTFDTAATAVDDGSNTTHALLHPEGDLRAPELYVSSESPFVAAMMATSLLHTIDLKLVKGDPFEFRWIMSLFLLGRLEATLDSSIKSGTRGNRLVALARCRCRGTSGRRRVGVLVVVLGVYLFFRPRKGEMVVRTSSNLQESRAVSIKRSLTSVERGG